MFKFRINLIRDSKQDFSAALTGLKGELRERVAYLFLVEFKKALSGQDTFDIWLNNNLYQLGEELRGFGLDAREVAEFFDVMRSIAIKIGSNHGASRDIVTLCHGDLASGPVIYGMLFAALANKKIELFHATHSIALLEQLYAAFFHNNINLVTEILRLNEAGGGNLKSPRNIADAINNCDKEESSLSAHFTSTTPWKLFTGEFNAVNHAGYCLEKSDNLVRLILGGSVKQGLIVGHNINIIFRNYLEILSRRKQRLLYISLSNNHSYNDMLLSLRDTRFCVSATVVVMPGNDDNFIKGFDITTGRQRFNSIEEDMYTQYTEIYDFIQSIVFNSHNNIHLALRNVADVSSDEGIKRDLEILYSQTVADILGEAEIDFTKHRNISMSQRQAILFHFFKHKFTQYLIKRLKPNILIVGHEAAESVETIHNVWNMFCSRVEDERYMSAKEFEELLQMPSLLSEDRLIDEQVNLLVNVMGYYYHHLSACKRVNIPWVADWLQRQSWYKDKHGLVYSKGEMDDSDKKQYLVLNQNELYNLVASGDEQAIKKLLGDHGKVLSFWDGEWKGDTALILAAKLGHFSIFDQLLEFLDHNKNNFIEGVRSKACKSGGTAANYLCRHLVYDSCDSTEVNDTGMADNHEWAFASLKKYMLSIINNRSLSVSFSNYTAQYDEYGLTPLDYLAMHTATEHLKELQELCKCSKNVLFASLSSVWYGVGDHYCFEDFFYPKDRQIKDLMLSAANTRNANVFLDFLSENCPSYCKVEDRAQYEAGRNRSGSLSNSTKCR